MTDPLTMMADGGRTGVEASALAIPHVTTTIYDAVLSEKLRRQAKALVGGITDDESGHMVAGQWVGGHGGLLSRQTIYLADQVRMTLAKMERRA